MSGPLPPADLDRRQPEMVNFRRGRGSPLLYGQVGSDLLRQVDQGRFNAPDASYGVLYAARRPTAPSPRRFCESRAHAHRYGSPPAEGLCRIVVERDLKVIRLAGPGLARVGATAEVAHSGLPTMCRRRGRSRWPVIPLVLTASPTMPGMMTLNSAMRCSSDRPMRSRSRPARSTSIRTGSGGIAERYGVGLAP